MSSVVKSGNLVHDNACLAALGVLQTAIAGVTSQATVNAAYIVFHRAVVASCKLNNNSIGIDPSLGALRSLGVNG